MGKEQHWPSSEVFVCLFVVGGMFGLDFFVCCFCWVLVLRVFLIAKQMMNVSVGFFIEVLPVSFTVQCLSVWTRDQSAMPSLKMLSWPGHKLNYSTVSIAFSSKNSAIPET